MDGRKRGREEDEGLDDLADMFEEEEACERRTKRRAAAVPVCEHYMTQWTERQDSVGLSARALYDDLKLPLREELGPRNRIVFGTGMPVNTRMKIVIVGEAPGKDEAASGVPFVGVSGELLKKLLKMYNIDPDNDVFITNVMHLRPTELRPGYNGNDYLGDRQPNYEEMAGHVPHLSSAIALEERTIVIAMGRTASTVLRCDMDLSRVVSSDGNVEFDKIGAIHGVEEAHFCPGMKRGYWVVPMYHPSYLLRTAKGDERSGTKARPVESLPAWRRWIQAMDNVMRLIKENVQPPNRPEPFCVDYEGDWTDTNKTTFAKREQVPADYFESRENLEFQVTSMLYDRASNKIQASGRTEEGHSVICNVDSLIFPFFVNALDHDEIDAAERARRVDVIRYHILKKVMDNSSTQGYNVANGLQLSMRAVVKKNCMGYYSRFYPEQYYVEITVNRHSHVRTIERLLDDALRAAWNDPEWRKRPETMSPTMRAVKLFESDFDAVSMFSYGTGIKACNWIRIKRGNYTPLVGWATRKATTDIEIETHRQCVSQCDPTDPKYVAYAPFSIMSGDIECNNTGGKFPRADRDAVITICLALLKIDKSTKINRKTGKCPTTQKVCFTLKDVKPPAGRRDENMEGSVTYMFNDERQLLLALRRFILQYDADIIAGHNVKRFDLTYIIKRASFLGLCERDGWGFMGRVEGPPPVVSEKKFQSRAFGTRIITVIPLPHRIVVDTCEVYMREKKEPSYKLGAIGVKYLGVGKNDMPPEQIPVYFAGSPEDRWILTAYCLVDSLLVLWLLMYHQWITSIFEFARMNGCVYPDDMYVRGQQAKVLSCFKHEIVASGNEYILPRQAFESDNEIEKDVETYMLKGGVRDGVSEQLASMEYERDENADFELIHVNSDGTTKKRKLEFVDEIDEETTEYVGGSLKCRRIDQMFGLRPKGEAEGGEQQAPQHVTVPFLVKKQKEGFVAYAKDKVLAEETLVEAEQCIGPSVEELPAAIELPVILEKTKGKFFDIRSFGKASPASSLSSTARVSAAAAIGSNDPRKKARVVGGARKDAPRKPGAVPKDAKVKVMMRKAKDLASSKKKKYTAKPLTKEEEEAAIKILKAADAAAGRKDVSYEGANVLEALVRLFKQPVIVLDFASLYPAIMMDNNLSGELKVLHRDLSHHFLRECDVFWSAQASIVAETKGEKYGFVKREYLQSRSRSEIAANGYTVAEFDEATQKFKIETDPLLKKKQLIPVPFGPEAESQPWSNAARQYIEKDLGLPSYFEWINNRFKDGTPRHFKTDEEDALYVFVDKEVGMGILPRQLTRLGIKRSEAKKLRDHWIGTPLYAVFEGKQNSIKIIMNSAYGMCGATFGKLSEMDIANTVTSVGRKSLETARDVALSHFSQGPWKALMDKSMRERGTEHLCAGGDTDSTFDVLGLVSNVDEGMELGPRIAQVVNTRFRLPMQITFEKVIWPMLIVARKRYTGMWHTGELNGEYYSKKRWVELFCEQSEWKSIFEGYQWLYQTFDSEAEYQKWASKPNNKCHEVENSKELIPGKDGTSKVRIKFDVSFDERTFQTQEEFDEWAEGNEHLASKISAKWFVETKVTDKPRTVYVPKDENDQGGKPFRVRYSTGRYTWNENDVWKTKGEWNNLIWGESKRRSAQTDEEFIVDFLKPRYEGVGHNVWSHGVMQAKGIETVRRDSLPFVAAKLKTMLTVLLRTLDVERITKIAEKAMLDLLEGRVHASKLISSKQLYQDPRNYKSKLPHLHVLEKQQMRGEEAAEIGDRVPFLMMRMHKIQYIDKNTGRMKLRDAKVFEKAEDPMYMLKNNIPPDYDHYFEKQCRKPLLRPLRIICGDRIDSRFTRQALTRKVEKPRLMEGNQLHGYAVKVVECMCCGSSRTKGQGYNTQPVCKACLEKLPEQAIQVALKRVEADIAKDMMVLESRYIPECQKCTKSDDLRPPCRNVSCPFKNFYGRMNLEFEIERKEALRESLCSRLRGVNLDW